MSYGKRRIGKEQAMQKLKHYCGYQERSHVEAREKLYSFGLYKQEVEECICRLIEDDYLNEERFAIAYTGGKFRMKQWGRIKIRQGLKERGVSEYCIKKSLEEIDPDQYNETLNKLVAGKWKDLHSEKNIFIKMRKTQDYVLQRGFELNLVAAAIQQVKSFREED